MRLWIESAYQSLGRAIAETPGGVVSTFKTEEQFVAIVGGALPVDLVAEKVVAELKRGTSLDAAVESILAELPAGEHESFSVLQVRGGHQAGLIECDAPPLFMARKGRLVLLPVVEEELRDRLVRRCEFNLQDGDHLAMVSEGYIQAVGWDRRWGWRDIAVSIRRLTETRCDAEQLAAALIRAYQRLTGLSGQERVGERRELREREQETVACVPQAGQATLYGTESSLSTVSVLAMFVRPMRTVTVWSGPPASRASEREVLEKLMAEEDMRIICGDTTAEIAARLLGAQLVLEPRPEDGWAEVPPTSRMVRTDSAEPVDLITEGAVTLGVARERIVEARDGRARDLTGREDGASRLARMLLTADKVCFLVGLALNPAQTTAAGVPWRRIVIEKLIADLKAWGKIVSVEYV